MSYGNRKSVLDLARGKWKGILLTMGIDAKHLSGKNVPCPQCDGYDRFRFTDFKGDGDSICNQCGSLTGMQLLQAVKGWDFKDAAKEVEDVLGEVRNDPARPKMDDDQRRKLLNDLWASGERITKGDPVDTYLAARNVDDDSYPSVLRMVPSLDYTRDLSFPAMIARVETPEGQPLSIHRTWINGDDKAPVDTPRKMMPGSMAGHGAVRLGEPAYGALGVAEGIETAFAASHRYNVPVWAALNAGSMAAFQWPEGVTDLFVFGDNDSSYTGQAVAYTLARRARSKGLNVTVHIPSEADTDFADMARGN